jgi:tRNA pseudouridine55 synthase
LNTSGFLLINKPQGPTSFDIVSKIRKKLGVKKVGHCGTLDPLAEGLLVVAVGNATRFIQYLGDDKIYEFGIIFGQQTQTGDREGKVVKECGEIPTKEKLLEIIPDFCVEIMQTPPVFSAVKICGKRAYELARAGIPVEMKERKVKIYSLELKHYDFEQKTAVFRVFCSSGTYVRSLAQDIAAQCGTLGFCSFIKRICVGNFNLQNAVSADDANENNIIPLEKAIILPKIELNEADFCKIKNGNVISIAAADTAQIWLEYKGDLAAFGKVENELAKPILVLVSNLP